MKYTFICSLALLALPAMAQSNQPTINQTPAAKPASTKRIVYGYVEQMPKYPNGGYSGVLRYIANNLRLPEEVKTGKREGIVFVTFEIDVQGKLQDPAVRRGLSPATDEEALRVVRAMPNWIPGSHNGINVIVTMTVPVRFSLKPQVIPDHYDPVLEKLSVVD